MDWCGHIHQQTLRVNASLSDGVFTHEVGCFCTVLRTAGRHHSSPDAQAGQDHELE